MLSLTATENKMRFTISVRLYTLSHNIMSEMNFRLQKTKNRLTAFFCQSNTGLSNLNESQSIPGKIRYFRLPVSGVNMQNLQGHIHRRIEWCDCSDYFHHDTGTHPQLVQTFCNFFRFVVERQ